MKFDCNYKLLRCGRSPPARGAWVEIPCAGAASTRNTKSPPARGAWVEIIGSDIGFH